jgi:hypothetical protein
MDKPQRTREQLRIAISTRLALSSACREGIEVSVFPTDGQGGWDAAGTSLRGPPDAYADCLSFLKIVVSALKAEFDLAPEPTRSDKRPRLPLEAGHFPAGESLDEAAKRITEVALSLRENIAATSSDLQANDSNAPPQPPLNEVVGPQHDQERVRPVTGPAVAKAPIAETIYPAEPSGEVVVHNHITIDLQSAEYREFSTKVDDLLTLLRESNEFSGEVRDQLIAEISAGRTLLSAPKADPILIERFLTNPLRYIANKTVGTAMAVLTMALMILLGKLT